MSDLDDVIVSKC